MTIPIRHVTRKKYRQGMRSNARAYRYYTRPELLEWFRDSYVDIFGEHHELVELKNDLIKSRDNGALRRVLLEQGITQRWAVRRGRRCRRDRK